jgi:hypothetical protein
MKIGSTSSTKETLVGVTTSLPPTVRSTRVTAVAATGALAPLIDIPLPSAEPMVTRPGATS